MLYELSNNNYHIKVNSLGGELKSILFYGEEYIHQGDEYWHRSSPVLFPIVGKLKNNNYKYNNKRYTLAIHGFARFNEFELIKQSNKELCFLLQENKSTLKHYPFSFSFKIIYILDEHSLCIKYEISGDEGMLFSFGAHPAFLLKADINDSYLEFEQKERANLLCLDLQNGCVGSTKKDYLNSNILKLNSNIFKNDALIFKDLNSNKVSLKNTKNTKNINVIFKNFSHIGFWAPLNAPFVCIEPWCGIADNVNTNHSLGEKDSIVKLGKNEIFSRSMLISLH